MKTRGCGLVSPSSLFLARSMVISRKRLRDLDRGKPDPGRVVHGLEHVVGELADLRRDLLDRLGDEPQLLVRQDDDFSNAMISQMSWRAI